MGAEIIICYATAPSLDLQRIPTVERLLAASPRPVDVSPGRLTCRSRGVEPSSIVSPGGEINLNIVSCIIDLLVGIRGG